MNGDEIEIETPPAALAVEEAAWRYGLEDAWLQGRVDSGYLKCWDDAGRTMVRSADVEALLPQFGVLTLSQACDRFSLHLPWLREKVTTGQLAHWVLEGQIRVRDEDVAALAATMVVREDRRVVRALQVGFALLVVVVLAASAGGAVGAALLVTIPVAVVIAIVIETRPPKEPSAGPLPRPRRPAQRQSPASRPRSAGGVAPRPPRRSRNRAIPRSPRR